MDRVQEGLGGNAARVQADAPRLGQGIHQGDLHTLIGRQKCRRIPPRSGADDGQIAFVNLSHAQLTCYYRWEIVRLPLDEGRTQPGAFSAYPPWRQILPWFAHPAKINLRPVRK